MNSAVNPAMNPVELEAELDWLGRVLDLRFRHYFAAADASPAPTDPRDTVPPDLSGSASAYAALVQNHANDGPARLALVLALAPLLRPQLLDLFFTKNATFDRRFTEFGGQRADDEFEPDGETLAFLLGGGTVAARLDAARLLAPDQPLLRHGVLRLEPRQPGRPVLKALLRLGADYLAWFTTGQRGQMTALQSDFPAQRIETALGWDDLILPLATRSQVLEIQTYIEHGQTLMHDWGMAARLRPGMRALFHGPPGTGKTLSAALLGKHTGHEVYRIDLSLMVSKYIGETEKNLARVFDQAERQGWILFFDEADALFGKRSETRDAHDRYANQETAFLLQRIETFDGIVILASNLRQNLDDAFSRRFELMVYFPMPRPAERQELWRRAMPTQAKVDASVDLAALARQHELSGGAIMNVIRQISLQSIANQGRTITEQDLAQAIRRELEKEGR